MKESEIDDLILKNDDNKLSFYLNIILSKLKDISKENDKLGITMIIVIFLYYLINNSIAKTINIGPISIDQLSKIKIFIPLLFAFLILRYKIISAHSAELLRIMKKINSHYFNVENSNIKPEFTDDFTRTLIPLSIYQEINKLSYKGKSLIGCLGAVVIIPLTLILTIIPYLLEYYWIKELLGSFENLNIYEKISVILTIWILVLSIYYLIHTMILGVKEQN